jgi:ParB family transcriptional regulator, chromosome partitioning protein
MSMKKLNEQMRHALGSAREEQKKTKEVTSEDVNSDAPRVRSSLGNPTASVIAAPFVEAARLERDAALARVVALESKAGMPTMVPIEQIKLVQGRRRKLTEDEFSQLVENLRNNELVQPVVLKRLADNEFELVSGYNRLDAYVVLRRKEIPSVIHNEDWDQASIVRAAFFANLIQSPLPDFEKYKGFKAMMATSKADQKSTALQAGISASWLARLMVFEKLPNSINKLLDAHPHAIGANVAEKLVPMCEAGRSEDVLKALQEAIAGGLPQEQIIRLLRNKPTTQSSTNEPIKIKNGRSVVCTVRSTETTIRLDFANAELKSEVEKHVLAFLRNK